MALVVLLFLCEYALRQEDVWEKGVKAPHILDLGNKWLWLSASRFDHWKAVPSGEETP